MLWQLGVSDRLRERHRQDVHKNSKNASIERKDRLSNMQTLYNDISYYNIYREERTKYNTRDNKMCYIKRKRTKYITLRELEDKTDHI